MVKRENNITIRYDRSDVMKKTISILLILLITLFSFSASYASNETLDFLGRINSAQTASQIRALLQARTDLEFDLSSIYYKDNIYGGLVGQNFASMTELNNCGMGLTIAEESDPKVALYRGTEQVTSLGTGAHKIVVAPLLKEGVKIVAATYKDGALNTYDIKDGSTTQSTELSLGNMTGGETSKVIFLESLDNLKPLNTFELFYDDKIEIYVSADGKADGDGSRAKPFGSLEAAQSYVRTINSNMNCDIRVNILPGDYYITEPLEFTELDSGTNGFEIIWSGSYGDDLPLISGGVPVKDWSPYKDGIYKAHVDGADEARQFYVDGIPAQRAISDGYYIAEKIFETSVHNQVNYEFDDYTDTSVFEDKGASGELVAASAWTSANPSMEFKINIPEDGTYDVSYVMGYCSSAYSYSKVYLELDGASLANNLTAGTNLDGFADTYGTLPRSQQVHRYTKSNVPLTAGEHTLTVKAEVVQSDTDYKWYTYVLDNITFAQYEKGEVKYTETDLDSFTVEFENYTTSNVRDDNIASGKKVYANPYTGGDPDMEFSFNVPESGYYDASYIMGYLTTTVGSYSHIDLYLDGNVLGNNDSAGTLLSGYATGTYMANASWYAQPIHKYTKKGIWLDAGAHTIKVDAQTVSPTATHYTYTLDCIEFTASEIDQGFYLSGYDLPEFSHPEELELVVPVLWAQQRLPVKDVIALPDEDRHIFAMDMPYYYSYINMSSEGEIQPTAGTWFYIENALELLDEPGEFWFDKDNSDIYYYPHSSSELTAEAYIPVSEGLMSIRGTSAQSKVSNIRFTGLDFRHGAYNELSDTGLTTLQADCLMPHSSPGLEPSSKGYTTPSQIYVEYADGIVIENCRMANLGSAAVDMSRGVSNSAITNNVVNDISSTGFIVGSWRYNTTDSATELCSDIDITGNYIRRIGQELMGSPAIGVYYAKNIDISHNDIADIPYTGITIGWGWGSATPETLGCGGHSIVGNRIDANSRIMRDGGAIYTNGKFSSSGVYIAENYITDSPDFAAIYMDTGSSYITIEKNVVANVVGGTAYNWTRGEPANSTLRNNYVMSTQNRLTYPSIAVNTTVVSNGNWTGEAKSIADNAGLPDGYKGITACESRPQSCGTVYDYMPADEMTGVNDIILECEDYTSGTANPAIHSRGKDRYLLSGFANGHRYEYRFNVPVAGRYRVELRYSMGKDYKTDTVYGYATINAARNNGSNLTNIPLRGTDTYFVSQPSVRLGELDLPAGDNTLTLLNAGGTWGFDNIKLIYIGD